MTFHNKMTRSSHRTGFFASVRGQSIIEYIAVSIALIAAVFAVQGLIEGATQGLMEEVRTQMTARGGVADPLLE